jgi:hypothetical protein
MTDETIPPEAIGYRIERDPRSGLFIVTGADHFGTYSNLYAAPLTYESRVLGSWPKALDVEGVEVIEDGKRQLPEHVASACNVPRGRSR